MQVSREQHGETRRPSSNEQCVKLEGINRRGKTRDLFRKIGNIKRTFCPKMGTLKDRNSVYLVDAKEMERIHGRTVQKISR